MKCINCGKEFSSKRGTAKYCSLACRVKANRKVSVTESEQVSVTDISVTPVSVTKPLSVTSLKAGSLYTKRKGTQEIPCKCDESYVLSPLQAIDCPCGLRVVNRPPYKPASLLEIGERNSVSLPGDFDYEGVVPPINNKN